MWRSRQPLFALVLWTGMEGSLSCHSVLIHSTTPFRPGIRQGGVFRTYSNLDRRGNDNYKHIDNYYQPYMFHFKRCISPFSTHTKFLAMVLRKLSGGITDRLFLKWNASEVYYGITKIRSTFRNVLVISLMPGPLVPLISKSFKWI